MPRELQLIFAHNVLIHLHSILIVVRGESSQKLVEKGSQLVVVQRVAVTGSLEHLGAHVLGGTAKGLCKVVGSEIHLGKPEISETEVPFGVYQDVFWLQISIDDVSAMKMLEG